MKHTSGPWKIKDGELYAGGAVLATIFGAEDEDSLWGEGQKTDEEARANARLIAASVDLFDACVEFVRKVECGEARSKRSYAQMKAAIAKTEE